MCINIHMYILRYDISLVRSCHYYIYIHKCIWDYMRLDCDDSQTQKKQFLELLPLFPSCITSISILLWLRHLLRIFEHFFNLSRTILNDNYYKCGLTFDVENLRKDMRSTLSSIIGTTSGWSIIMFSLWEKPYLMRWKIQSGTELSWKDSENTKMVQHKEKDELDTSMKCKRYNCWKTGGRSDPSFIYQVLQACGRSEIHLQKMGARGPPVWSKWRIASFSCRIPFMTHQSTSSLDSGPVPSSLLQRGSHCNLCPFEIASSRTYFWPQQTTSQPQLVNHPQTWDLSCTHPGNPAMIPSSHFQRRIPAPTEQIPRCKYWCTIQNSWLVPSLYVIVYDLYICVFTYLNYS